MGRQTSIFDAISKNDDFIDTFLNFVVKEIKNFKYLRKCLKLQYDYERDKSLKKKVYHSMVCLENASYFACLLGYCVETCKSESMTGMGHMNRWGDMNMIDYDKFSGEGLSYEGISEAIARAEVRIKERVMSSKNDNLHNIDEARRMLSLYLDSSAEAKSGTRFAALKKINDGI